MARVYIYVVDRDFGFAPNPFHGFCTLATCKPAIRNTAKVGDWIIGVGGKRLKATGKCIFAMKITQKITFNEYWEKEEYRDKKPVRNGSKIMMLGDNIYHQNQESIWEQAHSHHSNPDGSINTYNLERDTKSNYVLISKHFYYFGNSAPLVPKNIFQEIGYQNKIGHRVFDHNKSMKIIQWLEEQYSSYKNLVLSDPFNFKIGHAHYSVENDALKGL
ncbi:hypothetical protein [Flavisolibacter ginsenosidimutans]|uniref:Nucleotide modification associated domain-containing protein n=1 Tax=Flavisolibacter ginsenosidimutans TaxID=661481 RepID=A0A5B8UJR4_9BACT|nr:hypothetical protein [Flavisolibacter ginsenosidimutans]QEC56642.1 hypothetical protein FSB75_12300 [Flavisolibacter ginsenosidimutans]